MLLALIISAFCNTKVAATGETSLQPSSAKLLSGLQQTLEKIDDSIFLNGVMVFETEAGLLAVTLDGRYTFTGSVYDNWHQEELASVGEIKRLKDNTPVKEMGIRFKDFNSVALGKGDQQVSIFLDPISAKSPELLDSLDGFDEGKFQVNIIFLPEKNAGNMPAAEVFQKIETMSEEVKKDHLIPAIAKSDPKKVMKLLKEQKTKAKGLSEQKALTYSMVVRKFLGINTLPTVIVHQTGDTFRGDDVDIKNILGLKG